MKKYYDCGIDLGTTNSCIAIPDADQGYRILNNSGSNKQVTPSAVLIKTNRKGRVEYVGEEAYESADTKNVGRFFKRMMGTSEIVHFPQANEEWGPEELSSLVLKEMINQSLGQCDKPIQDVVITVPAEFSILQNEATKRAGEKAGFRNIELLQEPIAASIAYGMKANTENQYWLVFDFGGGTLDTAIVSTHGGRLKVVNCSGNQFLGGRDIDDVVLKKIILPKMAEEYNIDQNNMAFMRKMLLLAEKCKIKLSTQDVVEVEANYDFDPRAMVDADGEEIDFFCEITREEFERAIKEIIDRAIESAKVAVEESGINIKQFEKIILVGGTTYIPALRRAIEENFPIPIECSLNPMTVVAAGAAIYAAQTGIEIQNDNNSSVSGKIELKLQYDHVTAKQKQSLKGVIIGNEFQKAEKIKVDIFGSEDYTFSLFTSGWVEVKNKERGIFAVEIILPKEGTNYLRVSAMDQNGKLILLNETDYSIIYNKNIKKIAPAILNRSLSVRVADMNDTRLDKLQPLIEKNSPYPLDSVQKSVYCTKELDPDGEQVEVIRIEIWEGEVFENPRANEYVGCMEICSNKIKRKIHANSEIQIVLHIDKDRNLKVTGYVPSIDYNIESALLRPESVTEQLDDTLDQLEKDLNRLFNKLSELADVIEVKTYAKRATEIRDRFVALNQMAEVDIAEIKRLVRDFYALQTEIIMLENEFDHNDERIEEDQQSVVEEATTYLKERANNSDLERLADLTEKFEKAEIQEDKEYYKTEIKNMQTEYQWGKDIEFLKNALQIMLHPAVTYTDEARAGIWKEKGNYAADNDDIDGIREAIFQLVDIAEKNMEDIAADIREGEK